MKDQNTEQSYLYSSYREKMFEHIFLSELLKISWLKGDILEISHPEVDNSGYDLIIENGKIIRHIQLKSSFTNGSAKSQKLHVKLENKPKPCVLWIEFNPKSITIDLIRFFGKKNNENENFPNIKNLAIAKTTKGDSTGKKKERVSIRNLPKGKFDIYEINELYDVLFK